MNKENRIQRLSELKDLGEGQEILWEECPDEGGSKEYVTITRFPSGFLWKIDKYDPFAGGNNPFLGTFMIYIPESDIFKKPGLIRRLLTKIGILK